VVLVVVVGDEEPQALSSSAALATNAPAEMIFMFVTPP
jgi:hypothetical protein